MYYKFTLEKLDYDRNVILTTQVMLTEEMIKDTESQGMDILKYTSGQLVDKFRYNEKQNEKLEQRKNIVEIIKADEKDGLYES